MTSFLSRLLAYSRKRGFSFNFHTPEPSLFAGGRSFLYLDHVFTEMARMEWNDFIMAAAIWQIHISRTLALSSPPTLLPPSFPSLPPQLSSPNPHPYTLTFYSSSTSNSLILLPYCLPLSPTVPYIFPFLLFSHLPFNPPTSVLT
jgi:hypothetical protein